MRRKAHCSLDKGNVLKVVMLAVEQEKYQLNMKDWGFSLDFTRPHYSKSDPMSNLQQPAPAPFLFFAPSKLSQVEKPLRAE